MSELFLITQDYPPRPGGMARYYADLAAGLGRSCSVFAGSWEGHSPNRQDEERVVALPFDSGQSHRFWNLRRAIRKLGGEITRRHPAALLIGNIRPFGPAGIALARKKNTSPVLLYHGNDLLRTARRWAEHPVKRRRWRTVLSDPRLHIVNSRYTAGEAKRLGLPSDCIAVVHPEVNPARFRPSVSAEERAADRRLFDLNASETVTLFVGRPVARKGVDVIIDALGARRGDSTVVFAGSGDWRPWKERAEAAGVAARTRFIGSVGDEELPQLYRSADLFVGPSRARAEADDVEGFGIVFLEAACSGVPILATKTGGVPEAVEHGSGGILVEPGSVTAFAEAWSALIADPKWRLQLGAEGRRTRSASHGRGTSARRLGGALRDAGIITD